VHPTATVTSTAKRALSIRRATPDDLQIVIRLRIALLREHAGSPLYGRLRHDAEARAAIVFASQLKADDQVMFLAERGSEVVGILRCADTAGSPLLAPERYGYISSVYVVPAARREGVLNALFHAAEEWCRDRHLTELRLHNVPDNPMSSGAWTALGFEVVEHLRMRRIGGG
jgi:ribosomal protein S18 acetylase RimI-like enzyme